MKKIWLLVALQLLFCSIVSAQKIQYSRGSIKAPDKSYVRLLADVNNYHHLIQFLPEGKPVISVFNKDLNLEATIELNLVIDENTEVKIIQFDNDYWLYTYKNKSSKHQLLKINGNGIIEDQSGLLNNPADSAWNKTTSSLNLTKIGNNLYVIVNKYFDQLKKMTFSLIKIEAEKQAIVQHQLYLPLNTENEHIKDITVFKNKLFLLKTGKDESGKNILYVLKSDLATGQSHTNQFESGKYMFQNPSFKFSNTDSSVFLYAMMVAPVGFKGTEPSLFMVKLNESLNEIAPVQILKNILPETVASSFVVEKENTSGWICFSKYQKEYSGYSSGYFSSSSSIYYSYDFSMYNTYIAQYNPNLPSPVLGQYNGKEILFTILNNRLEIASDSLIKNKGRGLKADPLAYASFVLNKESYLLLAQQLTKRSKALLLVKPDDNNTLQTISLRTFDRYDYLLSLLQTTSDNAFIVPFTTKKEMGLMKVTLNN